MSAAKFPSFSSSLKKKKQRTPGVASAVFDGGGDANDDEGDNLVELAEETQEGVVEASKATLEVIGSPQLAHKRETFRKFFAFISETALWNEKKRKYVSKMLATDDASCLFEARATPTDNSRSKYGYTPLQVVADNGNMEPLRMFVEHLIGEKTDPQKALEYLALRNLEGQNVLHIAAREGYMDTVEALQQCEITLRKKLEQHVAVVDASAGTPPSSTAVVVAAVDSAHKLLRSPMLERQVDSMGLTPLAAGLLSPHGRGKNRSRLEQLLKQPSDVALFGKPVHPGLRFRTDPAMNLALSYAEIPGRRIHQEDAILVRLSSADKPFAVAGVFDGHGDCGLCSNFCAGAVEKKLYALLSAQEASDPSVLRSLFLEVDAEVRMEKSILGGSTGVVAVVTQDQIVVANLGDSRAILVQRRQGTVPSTVDTDSGIIVDTAVQQLENLSLSDGTTASSSPQAADRSPTPPLLTETQVPSTPPVQQPTVVNRVTVKPMSFDHDPNSETERKRIEAAGAAVEETRYADIEGKECVIYKVVREKNKLDKDRLAMARSFGDIEWKNNDKLKPEEQAVSAEPDVLVHDRTSDDTFLVIACDGIWDVMTNDEVGQFVADRVQSGLDREAVLSHVADLLLEECFNRGSADNMSVVVVALSEMANQVASTPRRQLNY